MANVPIKVLVEQLHTAIFFIILGWFTELKPATMHYLWYHQTWRAGKWTIEISDFPNKTAVQFGDVLASHV